MMRLSPVMTHEHHRHPHLPVATSEIEPEVTSSSLMVQCSKHVSHQPSEVNFTSQQAHHLDVELEALATLSADLPTGSAPASPNHPARWSTPIRELSGSAFKPRREDETG